MSIKYGLLALLVEGPRYGNQLRSEFERRTAATWPLNVGQVYTTISRLERDGLVEPAGDDDDGHPLYRLTDAGQADLAMWWQTPVRREGRPRDELAIKLALAVTLPGVDVRTLVQTQRSDTMRALQEYTRLKANQPGPDLAWQLVLDAFVFQAEAEIRWLDHCEARLVRAQGRTPDVRGGTPDVRGGTPDVVGGTPDVRGGRRHESAEHPPSGPAAVTAGSAASPGGVSQ